MRARAIPALALLIGITGGTPALAMELLVIDADNNELRVGTVIDGSQVMKLPAGARVTLVSPMGEILRLTGPFDAAPQSRARHASRTEERSLLQALRKLLVSETAYAPILGTTRSVAGDLRMLDIGRGGVRCVHADVAPLLTRRDAVLAERLEIARLDAEGASKVDVDFASGRRTAPWPASLPLADGGTYRLRSVEAGQSVDLTLRLVPGSLDPIPRIVWMAEHECTDQALHTLRALR